VCTKRRLPACSARNADFTPADPATLVATIAGDGQADSSGDEGPASAARLNAPEGLAFDAARNFLYIAENVDTT